MNSMADEKRLVGDSKDGRTLRAIANCTLQVLNNGAVLQAIANRLDQREGEIERLTMLLGDALSVCPASYRDPIVAKLKQKIAAEKAEGGKAWE